MEQKIIDCAIKLIQQYGIKFTLDDIAADAKISKKTIYKFFAGKEQLVNGVIEYIFADIHAQHEKILDEDIPNIEKLIKVLSVYPRVIHFDSLKLHKLIELQPEIYKRIDRQFHDNWDLTLSLYDKCVEDGSLKPIDREYFRLILLGIFDQAIHIEEHEKATAECINAVIYGFANEKARN